MSIVLMTTNARKIPEFRKFFSRYGQTLHVESPTEAPEILTTWLQTARAVVADESNIFTPQGDLVGSDYHGPARNICRLHAWVLKDGQVARRSYIREVAGTFNGSKLESEDATVFGWDAAFTPIEGLSLHDMAQVGLKNSAREQCLSAFTRAFLHNKEPKKLRWIEINALPVVDWGTDARLLLEHPLYQNLAAPLQSALNFIINQGVFFRSALGRRDGNYWLPGLNGGVPYVPKGDAIHEGTYMFHDLMHQIMPDLIFDGVDTPSHRHTYIAYRMMSEAVSLVLADMIFVHGLASSAAYRDYDFSTRHIYPLYQAIDSAKREDVRWLLKQLVRFVLFGEARELPTGTPVWENFERKYSRFFIGDFQWTRMNWANLAARTDMVRQWIELIFPETLHRQGIVTVSEAVNAVGRNLDSDRLAERLFDYVWDTRILPALSYREAADLTLSRANGFRRWLTGQCALFARYAPLTAIPALGYQLAERLRDMRSFSEAEMIEIRNQFRSHVTAMAQKGLISDDDATIFPDLFPLFDPFFLKDYDRAEQEFNTIAEASAVAFS